MGREDIKEGLDSRFTNIVDRLYEGDVSSVKDEDLLYLIKDKVSTDILSAIVDLVKEKHGLQNAVDEVSKTNFGYLISRSNDVRISNYGKDVYIRGLIEITNICKNRCLYCGISAANPNVSRYKLEPKQIVETAIHGYELGFRTFVMQGGEGGAYDKDEVARIVDAIKNKMPDTAVTLSLGEEDYSTYKLWKDAGADRYLLRHEAANKSLYEKLHPSNMSYENRVECLYNLKELGYQVGAGFMVGAPYQTLEDIVMDIRFLQKLQPDMIGIGPFVPHKDTLFAKEEKGDLSLTLKLLAILRLIFPKILLPSTTSLGTINPMGRELGLVSGGNVVMPNLSPVSVRAKYDLYDNKVSLGAESAECVDELTRIVDAIGYRVVIDRGDVRR